MEKIGKRSWHTRLMGFWQLCHPIPVFFHIVGVFVFTLLALWPRLEWSFIGLIVGAHAAMQLAIAVFNDYCDQKQDAIGKPEKPLPAGLVKPHEALILGCALIVLMFALLWPLPWLAGLLSLLYLSLGMAYNLGLKSTPLSGIVFALAMPLIPLYAFAGAGRNIPFLLWLVPLGFLLGVALNLANSLPDQEEDQASGAKTLAVTLGLRPAFLVSNTLLIGAAALILLLDLTAVLPVQPLALLLTLGLTALLLLAIFLLTGANKPRTTRKMYFYLVTLACIILTGGWFLGVFL